MKIKINNKIIILICLFLGLNQFSYSQVSLEWNNIYNGINDSDDVGLSIDVDESGNTYSTGKSYSNDTEFDIETIKYDVGGNFIWSRTFNGTGNSDDIPVLLKIDRFGNIYIIGYSKGVNSYFDYVTIKYNVNGELLWVSRYNGTGNGYDLPTSVFIDSSGNSYVTGYSNNPFSDYATVKYDSNGVELWVARYNGYIGYTEDLATSIAIDNSGNVYVTGTSFYDNITGYDYLTIKYNSDGQQQWIRNFSGNGYYTRESANSIITDNSGNIYVTGSSSRSGIQTEFATIKYNAEGDVLWIRKIDGNSNTCFAQSVKLDNLGNIFVLGTALITNNYSFMTVKYNTLGDLIWSSIYSGLASNIYAEPSDIDIDQWGNVYVAGSEYGNSSLNDFVILKYDQNGNEEWIVRYNGPENSNDNLYSIKVDKNGFIYATGKTYYSDTHFDFITLKYSQVLSINQITTSVPDKYSLSQNYPNPFNPTTNLEFGISELGFVSLKIYDGLGREVQTLVNEQLAPGTYNYQFSTINYPLSSGVYFYKLEAGSFVETKRMVLLK